MTTAQEAQKFFNDLAGQFDKVVEGLSVEKRATEKAIDQYKQDKRNIVLEFVPDLSPKSLDKIDQVLEAAAINRSLKTMVDGYNAGNQNIQSKITELEAELCDVGQQQEQLAIEKKVRSACLFGQNSNENYLSCIAAAQANINRYNQEHIDHITVDNFAKFKKFDFWRFVCDKNYRQARLIVCAYEAVGASYADDEYQKLRIEEERPNIAEKINKCNESIQSLEAIIHKNKTIANAIQEHKAEIKSSQSIQETVINSIIKMLDDQSSGDNLRIHFGPEIANRLHCIDLKIAKLRHSSLFLNKQITALEHGQKDMGEVCTKLDKAVRNRAGHRTVQIDTYKIKNTMKPKLDRAAALNKSAHQFRTSVVNFNTPDRNNTPVYYDDHSLANALMMYLILDNNDPAYLQHAADIDLSNLPSFQGEENIPHDGTSLLDAGISSEDIGVPLNADFNPADFDLGSSIDTGSLDMSSVDLGTFDFGDISGSVDVGSGGSFDFGGGSSSFDSSSYDSGGGGGSFDP